MRITILLFGFSLLFLTTNAQDFHFTDSYEMPLHISPAFSGAIPGQYANRFVAAHRRQGNAVLGNHDYETYYVSYDHRKQFCEGPFNGHYFGIGLEAIHDYGGQRLLGTTQFLETTQIRMNGSFGYTPTKKFSMILGFYGGWLFEGLDKNNLRFDNQFDGRNYNSTLSSGEIIYEDRINYFDLGTGFMVKGEHNNTNYEAGFAFLHLNNAKRRYLLSSEKQELLRGFRGHARLIFKLRRHDIIASVLLYKQGAIFSRNGRQWQFKPAAEIALLKKFFLVAGMRFSNLDNGLLNVDALTFSCKWKPYKGKYMHNKIHNIVLGIAYDINLSPYLARASNLRGGIEFFASRYFHIPKDVCCPEIW